MSKPKSNVTRVIDWAGGTWWGHVRFPDGDMVWLPLCEGPNDHTWAKVAWRSTVELTKAVSEQRLTPPVYGRRGESVSRKR